jgi:hypothetical protein
MMPLNSVQTVNVVHHLLSRFEQQRATPSFDASHEALWDLLCAAHIAGQHVFSLHMQTHLAMLRFAWQGRQWPEVMGQLMRLALVPIGHLLQRLPEGNSGRSNISAFKPMHVSPHLAHLIKQAAKMAA